MHEKLSSGHDTMDEAMRELASFIDDVSSGAGGDTDGDGDNPAGGDDPDGDGRSGNAPHLRSVEIRADGSHDAFTGTHTHSHAAFGSQGDDATHEHEHAHDGDASHNHSHSDRATGMPNHGILAVADGVTRTVHLAGGHDHMTAEQRAVFELGERVLKQTHDEAIQWAVRANIVQSPEDEQRYRALLVRCSYDEAQTFRASWEQIAKANLSPRGTWTPDRSAPGGGRWSDAPTMEGGRQTSAADPNDPQRIAASARRVGSGLVTLQPQQARAGDDAALYTVGGGKQRRRSGTGRSVK